MNSTFIAVAIMLILAACMFYGQTLYKKHKVEWGKALTIVCGIIIISTAIWLNFLRSEVDMKAIEREKLYQQAQALILANTLTNMYAGGSGKCLLLHHPTDTRNRVELDRLAEVFTRGFGGKVTEMRTVPIKDYVLSDEMSEEAMMESTAEDFNKVLAANADCDIVILMVPLPYSKEELNGIDILRMIPDADDPSKIKKDPSIKYPLVGIFNGYVGNLEYLFRDDLIHAMSLWKPDPTIDEEAVPDSVQDAFNKRYTIITPPSLDAVKSTFPKLFPKETKVDVP